MPKYWGGKLFRTRDFPRSGSEAKDGERRERERKLVITMAKLRMAHASTHGARKPPGPKCVKLTKRTLFLGHPLLV